MNLTTHKDFYSFEELITELKEIYENDFKPINDLIETLQNDKYTDVFGYFSFDEGMNILNNVENTHNCDSQIVVQFGELNKDLICIAFHLGGDVRCNYSDYLIISKELFNKIEEYLFIPYEDEV